MILLTRRFNDKMNIPVHYKHKAWDLAAVQLGSD